MTDFKAKAGVLVKKDDRGNLSVLESKERPLWGTGVGTAAGALIGLMAGAPGAALGAALGATSGLTGDAVMASLDSDFVDSVTQEMRPGMTALIVEADEKSTRPVDDIVKLTGGHVYRRSMRKTAWGARTRWVSVESRTFRVPASARKSD